MRKKIKYNMSLYQKRYRYSGFKKETEDVDITSLLDILVILLVFLIKNYSASPLEINLIPSLDLMTSQSKEAGQTYTLVQVNKDLDVFVEDLKVGNMKDNSFDQSFGSKLDKINKVIASKNRDLASKENSDKGKIKKKRETVNFVLDRTVKYENINRLMDLVAKYDYLNYKFIVKSNES